MEKVLHQLVFSGDLLKGRDPLQVRRILGEKLHLDGKALERLFSGQKQILKRDLELAVATRHVRTFAALGMVTRVEPMPASPSVKAKEQDPEAAASGTEKSALSFVRYWLSSWGLLGSIGLAITAWVILALFLLVILLDRSMLASWLLDWIPFAPVAILAHSFLLVFGVFFILLALKPLLSIPVLHTSHVVLDRRQQEDLYGFVDWLCEMQGIHPPSEIGLGSGADLEWKLSGKFLPWLFTGRSVLVIGMLLPESLSVRELAGRMVQAVHLGAPARASKAAHGLAAMEGWMDRALNRPDAVDRWLVRIRESSAQHASWAQSLQRMIRLARWPLSVIHRTLLYFMRSLQDYRSRQANAAAARLVGGKALYTGMKTACLLDYTAKKSVSALLRLWQKDAVLPRIVTTVITAQARKLPTGTYDKLSRLRQHQPALGLTGGLSRELRQEEGEFDCNSRSRILFQYPDKLLQTATLRFYHQHLQLPVTVRNLVNIPVKGSPEYLANHALEDYFNQSYVDFIHFGLLSKPQIAKDEAVLEADEKRGETRSAGKGRLDGLHASWSAAVTTLVEGRHRIQPHRLEVQEYDADLVAASNREIMHRAGYGRFLGDLPLLKGQQDEIHEMCRELEVSHATAVENLSSHLLPYGRRLTTALAALHVAAVQADWEAAAGLAAQADLLLETAGRIEQVYPHLQELRLSSILLASLLSHDSRHARGKLRYLLQEKGKEVSRAVQNIELLLREVPQPFVTGKNTGVMTWALRDAMPENGHASTLDRGMDTWQNLAQLQRLLLGQLCSIAVRTEQQLGWEIPASE